MTGGTAAERGATTEVTVLVPVHGEAERIERCLRAIQAQDWPSDHLQVVVVDGNPGDGTAEVVAEVLGAGPALAWTVVANPGGGRSANLNRGLAEARGSITCRVDARSAIPPGYVATCVRVLADPTVAVVGGAQVAVAPGDGPTAAGIARGLNNRLAMGMARYRRGGPSGPADTVYLGAFRTADLREVGGWDESLEVNEDFDLNRRLGRTGSIWYAAELQVAYQPRGRLADVARQYFGFGRWKVRSLRASGSRPGPRQLVGFVVAPAALAGLATVVALPGRARAVAVASGVVAALVVEQVGAPAGAPEAGPVARLWSLGVAASVTGSWSFGAWFELLRGGRRRG